MGDFFFLRSGSSKGKEGEGGALLDGGKGPPKGPPARPSCIVLKPSAVAAVPANASWGGAQPARAISGPPLRLLSGSPGRLPPLLAVLPTPSPLHAFTRAAIWGRGHDNDGWRQHNDRRCPLPKRRRRGAAGSPAPTGGAEERPCTQGARALARPPPPRPSSLSGGQRTASSTRAAGLGPART